jgi:NADPH2:quinone reductase
MTAHRCLFADGPIEGQTILVTGGAGAVGNYAIQLAKWGGAEIITTISSPEKEKHARQAGADYVINYRKEDVVSTIKELTKGAGVDRIIEVDFGGNLEVTKEVLKVNGSIACYASAGNREPTLPVYPLMYKNTNLHLVLVYNMPQKAKQDACKDIMQAIDDGKLKHAIAGRFPLDQLSAAHEAVESGSYIGNIVVEIGTAE